MSENTTVWQMTTSSGRTFQFTPVTFTRTIRVATHPIAAGHVAYIADRNGYPTTSIEQISDDQTVVTAAATRDHWTVGTAAKNAGVTMWDGTPEHLSLDTDDLKCALCGTRRHQTLWLLVDADTHTPTPVGETCIPDGRYSPTHTAAEQEITLQTVLERRARNVETLPRYDTLTVVAAAMAATASSPYISRAASHLGASTADQMERMLTSGRGAHRDEIGDLLLPAMLVIQTLTEWTPEPGFETSLHDAILLPEVTTKHFGVLAKTPDIYAVVERQRTQPDQPDQPEYADGFWQPVGGRATTEVTVTEVRTARTCWVITYRTPEGYRLTQFTYDTPTITPGHTTTIRATAKKHDTYRGVTSTVINRVQPA